MCTHHGARGEGKLRLQEVGSRYLIFFVFFYQITVHVPMKSQVIGICGDAVPRAVQKDALTLADTHGRRRIPRRPDRPRTGTAGSLLGQQPRGWARGPRPPRHYGDPWGFVPRVRLPAGHRRLLRGIRGGERVLHAGDHTTAAALAGVAATALHSGDALGIVRDFLHSVDGWCVRSCEAPRPVHRLDQHAGHPAGSPALSVVTRCKMRASAPLPVPCNSTQPLTFSYHR